MLNQNLSPPVSCFTTEAGVSSEGGATASNARLSWSPATLFTTVARRKSRNPVSTSSSGASCAGRSLGTRAASPGLISSRYAARQPRWLVDLQPVAEHPHAGILGLLDHCVRSMGHVGQILHGKGHRAFIDRNQVLRHLMTPCPGGGDDAPGSGVFAN